MIMWIIAAMRTAQWKSALDMVTSIAMLAAASTILWAFFRAPRPSAGPRIATPSEAISLDGAPILGMRQAPIALVEFSDFECPFCGKFATAILPDLKSKYIDSGQVLLAFRHLPLAIHKHALAAARAAECAARHSAFWPAHDRLFETLDLTDVSIQDAIGGVGITEAQMAACMASPASQVSRDLALANSLQIASTPTFLVGAVQLDGRVLVKSILEGARPLEQFENAIRTARDGTRE
jgi:protein-disulfide isomerase